MKKINNENLIIMVSRLMELKAHHSIIQDYYFSLDKTIRFYTGDAFFNVPVIELVQDFNSPKDFENLILSYYEKEIDK